MSSVAAPATERSSLASYLCSRSRRVTVLLLGVVALSVGDLVVTLTHLQTIGMIEANPIAAWLISTTNSVWPLAVFKLTTMGICVTLLYRQRRLLSGEIASWIAVGIMIALTAYWHYYTETFVSQSDQVILAQNATVDTSWMRID